MSEPKVQLVDPQGNMSVTGMSAVGVITASSFDGVSNSSATSITGTPDLDVGIVTATSFVGQGKGHAAGLAGTPELNLGVTTATSFVGDATGKAAGLTGTPNLNVGLVTATSFVGFVTGDVTGNISGLAVSITPGVNLGLGVCTAIQYHGDGSSLTGAASSAYIAQEITATTAETIIDLSDGNLIYYKGNFNTTVGFASTSAAEQIKFIRDADPSYTISYSTGGVDLDGTGDYLSMPTSTDFEFGTGDYTIEFWFYRTGGGQGNIYEGRDGGNTNRILFYVNSAERIAAYINGTGPNLGSVVITGRWYHAALCRSSGTNRIFLDGVLQTSWADTVDVDAPNGTFYIGHDPYNNPAQDFEGYLSNFRVIKGTALYTADFDPPYYDLTNVTNTKLLCCQSNSSTTTAAVTPGTITANGNVAAASRTITSLSPVTPSMTWPTGVTWNGGSAPTLVSGNNRSTAGQVFNLITCDSGTNWYGWEEVATDPNTNTLFAWGSNTDTGGSYGYAGSLGQNNQGAPTDRSSPVQIPGTTWSELTFSNSVLALKTDGTLWGWGNGSSGMPGLSNQTQRSSPTQIPGTTWSKLVKSQGGYGVAFAHKTDGTLWTWGYNDEGALGINNRTSYSSPVQLPGTTWSITSSDGRSSFGIKTDGTLWAWGYNQQGRLGLRPNIPSGQGEEMYSSPVQMAGNPGTGGRETGWVAVVPRMAINEDGTLWRWGPADNGQGGNNDNNQSLSMIQIPGTTWGQGMNKISTTPSNTGAIKTDGTLWTWGRNDNFGQLGQNDRTNRSSPVQVPGTTWSSIHVGAELMRATKTDGTMWIWGRNDDERKGNLGLSNVGVHRSSPTQIPGTLWSQKVGGMAGYAAAQLSLKQSD